MVYDVNKTKTLMRKDIEVITNNKVEAREKRIEYGMFPGILPPPPVPPSRHDYEPISTFARYNLFLFLPYNSSLFLMLNY